MDRQELRKQAHDLDVTLWVGKGGPEAVVDELDDQLTERGLVKAKVLRAALGGTDVESVAEALAERTGAEVVETRGKTAVLHR